ncbi:MAG TPA: DNA polymerase III subunit chi [Steroidobacteraceae bacterium]|nr:DNA polymerase III subunit chi [Steroidobacteraceae bacterium]
MGDNDGISASAASSGAESSPPASSAAEQKLRIDFYVIEGTAAAARLKVACRLAEKAYLASQRALIWHTDRTELEALDDLLWTFADGSFVPHDWLTSNAAAAEAPVLLSAGSPPVSAFDFVVNLAADPPPFLHLTRRIAEIIDGDEGRRRAGRLRFKAYRELGVEPSTHTLRAE